MNDIESELQRKSNEVQSLELEVEGLYLRLAAAENEVERLRAEIQHHVQGTIRLQDALAPGVVLQEQQDGSPDTDAASHDQGDGHQQQ